MKTQCRDFMKYWVACILLLEKCTVSLKSLRTPQKIKIFSYYEEKSCMQFYFETVSQWGISKTCQSWIWCEF